MSRQAAGGGDPVRYTPRRWKALGAQHCRRQKQPPLLSNGHAPRFWRMGNLGCIGLFALPCGGSWCIPYGCNTNAPCPNSSKEKASPMGATVTRHSELATPKRGRWKPCPALRNGDMNKGMKSLFRALMTPIFTGAEPDRRAKNGSDGTAGNSL
jgi:hypothetical protein